MMATNPEDMIPAEPVRRALETWLEQVRADEGSWDFNNFQTRTIRFSPLQQLVHRIWGTQERDENRHDQGTRIIFRLLNRKEGRAPSKKSGHVGTPYTQESINFDLADLILCKLELQHLWRTDPELSEAYQRIDLFRLDVSKPTSEVTARKARELVTQAWLNNKKNVLGTARELGLNEKVVKQMVVA